MDYRSMMDFRVAGAVINSALYLFAVFVAAIVTAHPVAMKFSIAAFGVTYLSYIAQLTWSQHLASSLVWVSIMLGIFAGLLLLF